MKKILITLALVVILSGSAFAGPIDWMMNQFGYTPTTELLNQKQQAEIERLKLQAQIAELEAKAKIRLYLLVSALFSAALAIYWGHPESISRVLSEIKIKAGKIFAKKEIPARSEKEIPS